MSDVQDILLRNIEIYIKSYKDSLKEKANLGFKKINCTIYIRSTMIKN